MDTININFHAGARSNRSRSKARKHRLPKCKSTGLARYRDRHQARDGATALACSSREHEISTFACPDCRGWHVEKHPKGRATAAPCITAQSAAFTASLSSRKRRYFLVDVENPTRGAKATPEEVAAFWRILREQAPGIAPHDHVVVGASRRVTRKYRAAIMGSNVKWIVGADAPDGADLALLGAIDLYRVARDYDELVIVSGDHAFAELAKRAKQSGLTVQVVTAEHPEQHTMLSRELADVADTQTLIRLKARSIRPGIATPTQQPEPISPRPGSAKRVAA